MEKNSSRKTIHPAKVEIVIAAMGGVDPRPGNWSPGPRGANGETDPINYFDRVFLYNLFSADGEGVIALSLKKEDTIS